MYVINLFSYPVVTSSFYHFLGEIFPYCSASCVSGTAGDEYIFHVQDEYWYKICLLIVSRIKRF